jgi:hypothetical protein
MTNLERDGVDYKQYLAVAMQAYSLMKGNQSGRIGKRKHQEAARLVFETLQKIIEDLPAIEKQTVTHSAPFPTSKDYFTYFLQIEKNIIVQAGASTEYAKKWIEMAEKIVNPSSLEQVQPENLALVLAEKFRISEQVLRSLEGEADLTTTQRRALLRLCYAVAAVGIFGANSILLPTSFPIVSSYGPALSQAIAGALMSSTFGKLPGV